MPADFHSSILILPATRIKIERSRYKICEYMIALALWIRGKPESTVNKHHYQNEYLSIIYDQSGKEDV